LEKRDTIHRYADPRARRRRIPDGELGQLVADDDLEDDDAEIDEQDQNAHTLSIRRADGDEVVTIFSPSEEWSVYLEPGGGIQNAFVGTPRATQLSGSMPLINRWCAMKTGHTSSASTSPN
jgi:hypothetical protein